MHRSILSRLIVVDTETTGANIFEHDLISYAFAPMTEGLVLEGYVFDTSGNPWSPVAQSYFEASKVRWQAERISPRHAVETIEAYLRSNFHGEDMIMVGHNVGFDRYFLEKLANQAGKERIEGLSHRSVDTHSLLIALHMNGAIPESATSSTGAFDYFGVSPPVESRHTALGDALATRQLFVRILQELNVWPQSPKL